jgi:hypothetical protein
MKDKRNIPTFESFSDDPERYLNPINEAEEDAPVQDATAGAEEEEQTDDAPKPEIKKVVPTFQEWAQQAGADSGDGPVEKNEDEILGAEMEETAAQDETAAAQDETVAAQDEAGAQDEVVADEEIAAQENDNTMSLTEE